MAEIYIVPNFHYDVAYLKTYGEYLPICFKNIDEALRILEENSGYRFLIEQTILLEEYWERFPEKREALKKFASEGRLAVAPGMYVMPDMNLPSGESMYMQARIGIGWLQQNLGIEPKTCWIADCWGHHAQLPQILTQCGYEYYAFFRCMHRELMRNDFTWQGLDGTSMKTHWLATAYSGMRFPDDAEIINEAELNLRKVSEGSMRQVWDLMQGYGESENIMVCNGGDFMFPQKSAPEVVKRLNNAGRLPNIRFATPEEYLKNVDWERMPAVGGEFNSSLQGTFTSNIRIKQQNRELTSRLTSLEALAVCLNSRGNYENLWKPVLKQQFHDILCGTICDDSLAECLAEYEAASKLIDEETARLSESGVPALFNPLPFERTVIADGNKKIELPALGFAALDQAKALPDLKEISLPAAFENEYYRAQIGENGFITSLVPTGGEELIKNNPCSFGALTMQMDNGDLWLNFESPLDGGCLESALTQNDPDPFDRTRENDILNRMTYIAKIEKATVKASDEAVIIKQEGTVSFWQLSVAFTTTICMYKGNPRIEYETRLHPKGRHYRIRAAFPTNIDGTIRHEIPFGVQIRGSHEHAAQNWIDNSDENRGLALINRGNPGNNVDGGIMMLTLFRAAAMEYKAPSENAFAEGVPHTFRYAILPHNRLDIADIVRVGQEFTVDPIKCAVENHAPSGWSVETPNVFVSALRRRGEDVFMRIYEAAGQETVAIIGIPPEFTSYTLTNGLERPASEITPCSGKIELSLKSFQIQGLLFKRG